MNFKSGFIAVIGRPNVGKSTLVNELIGQKLNITSHKAQTTRHSINAIDTQDNYQMVFVDTPGIHISNKKAINSYMNRAASSSIKEVDLILWLVEINKWNKEDERVLEHIKNNDTKVILCITKIDKLSEVQKSLPFLQKIGEKYQANEIFPLSAFNKSDVVSLREQILKYLPIGEAIFNKNYITDRSEKFVASEFIREKLMRNLHDEIPYELTVKIEKYELDGKMQRIHACIYVDKSSQKNIVIGKQGQMLKKIGTEARQSIESFLDRKVFLQLWVKVSSGWSDNRQLITNFGYD